MTSALRRQQLRKQELEKIKEDLKQGLPVLNKRQIRRHRIPYHEALCLELDEDGFKESASFIRSLIEYQENFRQKAGPESLVWLKPILKDDKNMIDKLYEGLKSAEAGVRANNTGTECDNLLALGVFYTQQADAWWWLAEQLLLECVNSASEYGDDGGQRHATARYVFGRFLLKQMHNVECAKEHLRICRELSAGQKWTAKEVLNIQQDTLFKESCALLYRALLIIARRTMEEDPLKAARMCAIAQKRAVDAEDNNGEAECLMQLGICEMKAGDSAAALTRFNRTLIMHYSTKDDIGICETRIHIALADSRIGNVTEANYHLLQLLEYATKRKMWYYIGQAHRFLGELHLNQGQMHEATPHLIHALRLFHELGDYDNREQVKNLAAISAAQELVGQFRKVILNCNNTREGMLNIMKCVKWKDNRQIFWDSDDTIKIDSCIFMKAEEPTDIFEYEFHGEMEEEPMYEGANQEILAETSVETTDKLDAPTSSYTSVDILDSDTAVIVETQNDI